MIIAGDIGGTKCHLAAFEEHGAELQLVARQRYPTANYRSFEEMLKHFREDLRGQTSSSDRIRAAGFGVPGTVVGAPVCIQSALGGGVPCSCDGAGCS